MKRQLTGLRRFLMHAKKTWLHAIRQELRSFTLLQIAVGLAILLIATQLTLLGINSLNDHKPILGLRLEGRVIGQLSGTDFRKQAASIVHSYENKKLTLKTGNYNSSITLRQLGVATDQKQLYARLLAEGRTGNILKRMLDQNKALLRHNNISLGHPRFNYQLAKDYLATIDQKIDVPPANAYFALDGGRVAIHPDRDGKVVNTDAAIAAILRADPASNSPVILPTKPTPAMVTTALLQPLLPQVQRIAQKPLTITAGSSQVSLTPQQLVSLIIPKIISDPKDSKKSLAQLSFDEAQLNATIDNLLKQVVVAAQPTVMRGGSIIRQGKAGLQAEDDRPVVRVLTAIIERQSGASLPEVVQLPLIAVNPPIVQDNTANVTTRTGTGLVRLTFDDGPGAYTERILDILKRYNVHATFYVIGRNVQRYPQTMQRIHNEGHAIGNHSFNHADLTALSRAGVQQELASTQAAIQQACGVTPTAFRPPYGAVNATVRDVAGSLGMSVDLWSVDARDWAQPGSRAITQRVLSSDGPGSVILLHVLHQQTVDALPGIIEGIRAQGYTLE